MDRMIYTGMNAAIHTMSQLSTTTNNLANSETTGFRAEISAFRAVPVNGPGNPTKVYVVDSVAGADFTPAPMQHTGRDLDLALLGKGWFAVKLADGSEAYTRAGSLKTSPDGVLLNRSGLEIQGESGSITIPPNTEVTVSTDGTISTVPAGPLVNAVQIIGKLKLVNPPEADLVKGGDQLFRLKNGKAADADPNVRIASGAVEGSNVNMIESMISMIDLGRMFDMNMKLLQAADQNAQHASSLMSLAG